MSACTVITDNKKAWGLANAHCPILWQEVKDIRDLLTPVLLGEIEESEIAQVLVREIGRPTLYYRVQENEDYYFLLYMVYHPFDWSDSKIPLLAKMDSHRHDTETISLRVKKGSWLGAPRKDAGCVAHSSINFQRGSTLDFYIQAEGHGISPLTDQSTVKRKNVLRYGNLKLKGFGELTDAELSGLKAEFNRRGVNFPDQQYDNQMALMFRHEPENHKADDLWNRPDMVFYLAERCGRL